MILKLINYLYIHLRATKNIFVKNCFVYINGINMIHVYYMYKYIEMTDQ